MFGAYFVIAIVIGHLASELREREQSERRREERATALYRFTRALAASRDLDEALPRALMLIKESFQADAAVWLRDESGLSLHQASLFTPSSKDESVAVWTFQKKQAAGRSTDTLPDAESLNVPLVTGDRAEGVLTVHLEESSNARATRASRCFRRAAGALREQRACLGGKPRDANCPTVAKTSKDTLRFRLA